MKNYYDVLGVSENASNDQIKNKVYKNDLPNGLNVISKSISAEFNLIN